MGIKDSEFHHKLNIHTMHFHETTNFIQTINFLNINKITKYNIRSCRILTLITIIISCECTATLLILRPLILAGQTPGAGTRCTANRAWHTFTTFFIPEIAITASGQTFTLEWETTETTQNTLCFGWSIACCTCWMTVSTAIVVEWGRKRKKIK